MGVIELQSHDDPRVADYAATSDPALARDRGLFVVEGRLVLARLIEEHRHTLRSVFVSDTARRDLAPLLQRLDPSIPVYVGGKDDFSRITGHRIHRGCLALAERPPAADARSLASECRTALVLEAIANPDNVGGIFRNASAFGAGAVFLSPSTCDPFYRKAIRTSMGATLRVPFARIEEWPAGLRALRAAGLRLVALTPHHEAEPIDAFAAARRGERLALLVGHEGDGLSDAAMAQAADRVRIPIRPDVDSLNVAVATGIALAELTRLTPRAHL